MARLHLYLDLHGGYLVYKKIVKLYIGDVCILLYIYYSQIGFLKKLPEDQLDQAISKVYQPYHFMILRAWRMILRF